MSSDLLAVRDAVPRLHHDVHYHARQPSHRHLQVTFNSRPVSAACSIGL